MRAPLLIIAAALAIVAIALSRPTAPPVASSAPRQTNTPTAWPATAVIVPYPGPVTPTPRSGLLTKVACVDPTGNTWWRYVPADLLGPPPWRELPCTSYDDQPPVPTLEPANLTPRSIMSEVRR